MSKTKITEENILIARRVPPGDKWRLVANEPDGPTHPTLTNALEAYMVKTGFKGEYRLAPLKSELYAISTTKEEIKPEPIQKFSIYGEY
jgi:hypothetical protein|tara:strand:+ start:253 stop:519 length:267 start_codon:yes stop_codon:yes gene_type:complete